MHLGNRDTLGREDDSSGNHLASRTQKLLLLGFLVSSWPCLAGAGGAVEDAGPIAGYVESVRVYPGGLELAGKLDTGAEHSSLDAEKLHRFERDGVQWVRFSVVSGKGRTIDFERKLLRVARIRRHDGGVQVRDVVRLGLCIGSVYKEVEVNLVDRSGFSYQLLVGRSFLGGNLLVDAGRTYLLSPRCENAPSAAGP